MIDPTTIGVIGSAILMAGWVYETCKAIRKHKALIDPTFAIFYLVGLSILTAYSYIIQNLVFLGLNSTLLSLVSLEVCYTLYLRSRRK